jgi:predicted ATPase
MPTSAQAPAVPRLTYLRIKNYRALRDVEFRDLTPLTVLIGPNGSGKSTVLDALDFLAEAVRGNLLSAWEKRGMLQGIRTRGEEGYIEFEVELLKNDNSGHIIFVLKLTEYEGQLHIQKEELYVRQSDGVHSLYIVEKEQGSLVKNITVYAKSPAYGKGGADLDVTGTNFSTEDRLLMLRLFNSFSFKGPLQDEFAGPLTASLSSCRIFHLTDDHLKGYSDAGPRSTLSPNGDNLPNVLYYLHLKHPEVLARIADKLRAWVPGLADVIPEITSDERLLLRFKDAPFEKPLPAQYMSGGTMRLAALLTLLYEPDATGLLGMEEPENELHPQLLGRLAEELIKTTETRQLLVATHSPFLLDALAPEQVWILDRGADGYTHATRAADIPNVKELVEDGSPLGYLWSSNFFTVGNPLGPRSTPADAR